MIKSLSLISLGQHHLHCKRIPTSCSQNFFTKKLQLFMSWSIFLFVSSLKINETIHSIRIKQWVQQKQNITHRYGSTKRSNVVKKIWNYMITFQSLIGTVQQILYESRTNAQWQNVSISHRYGPTGEPLKSMALGGRFQSLIGTVQQNSRWREKNRTFWVSIPHRYGSTWIFKEVCKFLKDLFQSLIGTIQQQYLLRFLFSLYPIFPVFQPF